MLMQSFGACAGNLVDMGKLAFAPATPEVLRLAAHMDASHELFGEAFHGVFRYTAVILLVVSMDRQSASALAYEYAGP